MLLLDHLECESGEENVPVLVPNSLNLDNWLDLTLSDSKRVELDPNAVRVVRPERDETAAGHCRHVGEPSRRLASEGVFGWKLGDRKQLVSYSTDPDLEPPWAPILNGHDANDGGTDWHPNVERFRFCDERSDAEPPKKDRPVRYPCHQCDRADEERSPAYEIIHERLECTSDGLGER